MVPLWLWLDVIASAFTGLRLYPDRALLEENPQYERHWAKSPSSLGHSHDSVLFAAYRGDLEAAKLDKYINSDLGEVVWPQWPVLLTINSTIDGVADRGLWIADISNYVPGDTDSCGSGAGQASGVCEYKAPRATIELLQQRLGEKFMGMDNGEQDGRYVSYAGQQLRSFSGSVANRASELRLNFLNFHRHFQRMTDDLGSYMMSLNSLYYPHYFAQTGLYTLLGAETAQGLPNDQLFYSFLRGAAKQYGSLLWGDASIGNRWWGTEGPKVCKANADDSACECSTNGTSLSLLRRLMYQQLLYGSAIFSFESDYTCLSADGNKTILAPVGAIQQAGRTWVNSYNNNRSSNKNNNKKKSSSSSSGIGAHVAQFAVMLDFFAGYQPPRHLYSRAVYRVWGQLPFTAGDHYAHAMMDILYPGYADASYFHDEKGFITHTPYSDAADVLLSDAPLWLLNRYPVLIVSELQSMKAEVAKKFDAYVSAGGMLVANAGTLAAISVAGVGVDRSACRTLSAGMTVAVNVSAGGVDLTEDVKEAVPVDVCRMVLSPEAQTASRVIAKTQDGATLAVQRAYGSGSLIAFASSGVASAPQVPLPFPRSTPSIDTPLGLPYPMASHVKLILDKAVLGPQAPFIAIPQAQLSVVTSRMKDGRYLVGVSNNGLAQQDLDVKAMCQLGRVKAVKEVELLDRGMEQLPGYMPTHTPEDTNLGRSTNTTIAGLDQRIFEVTTDESNVQLIQPPRPPSPPSHIALPLPACASAAQTGSAQEQILLRPSFFQHYDSVVVDWRYIESREAQHLEMEGTWAHRQGLRIIVDVTSGLNLYPDLRLCNNSKDEYGKSVARIEALLSKMSTRVNVTSATESTAQYSKDIIFSFHRTPENYYNAQQAMDDFVATTKRLTKAADDRHITMHLRVGEDNKPPRTYAEAVVVAADAGNPANLRFAMSSAVALNLGPLAWKSWDEKLIGVWLMSTAVTDPYDGSAVTIHGSLSTLGSEEQQHTAQLLQIIRKATTSKPVILLDAATPCGEDQQDAEFKEVDILEQLLASVSSV